MRCKCCNKDTDLEWNPDMKDFDVCPSCMGPTQEFMNMWHWKDKKDESSNREEPTLPEL